MAQWVNNKFILLLIIIFSFSNNSYGNEPTLYTWKDKNGVLIFSDTPNAHAKKIKLIDPALTMPATNTDILNELSKSPQPPVFKITILSPINNQSIYDNTGTMYVTSHITPHVKHEFEIQLFVDGKKYATTNSTARLTIKNIDRGKHRLQLLLFNNHGVIIKSEEVVFFMHRKGLNLHD